MADNKPNDFFAVLIKNPDLTITDLKNAGIDTNNSSFLTKEEYRNMPGVQNAFANEDGTFDEKKFNDNYDNASILYANYDSDLLVENISKNFEYSEENW